MIWLVGGEGMLGRQLAGELRRSAVDFFNTDRELDIADTPRLRRFIRGRRFRWIVNCAAYTAVDLAETEREEAFRVNGLGVENLAAIADEREAKIIHFSSDYVFDGCSRRPYGEEDPPHPVSAYGQSKRRGEELLLARTRRFFLLRTSWLYGVWGKNFVSTMLRLLAERDEVRVVCDQVGAPTWAGLLAENIVRILIMGESAHYGLYHYSDEGEISWFDFAVEIRRQALARGLLASAATVSAVPTSEYRTAAKRPAWSVLDSGKVVRDLGFTLRPWRENLEFYFREMAEAK